MPSMAVTVRAMIYDALRLCASDGALSDEEFGRVRDAARVIDVAPDVVAAIREIISDEHALRRRRYELIAAPYFLASSGNPGGG